MGTGRRGEGHDLEADPRDLPSSPPLKLFGPGHDSGTFDYFALAIVGVESKSHRNDYAGSEDDTVIANGIEAKIPTRSATLVRPTTRPTRTS